MTLYGGIESGGTKTVCAVGTGPDDVRAVERFPTTQPAETLRRAVAFFEAQPAPVAAVGIGSFGPVDERPGSPTFGHVTTTPKPGWQHVDVVTPVREALGVPVAFDTDVNAAALAEHRWGAARGLDAFVYLTVGTGIGGGGFVGGRRIRGLTHPEMGHLAVPRAPGDAFAGVCPFHGDCWEGLASGPAIEQRWGRPGRDLPPDHPAWDLQAGYLAAGLMSLVLALSPERVVVGGGVMEHAPLLARVREALRQRLNGYLPVADFDAYLVPPALGARAGVLGALALAQDVAGPTPA